MNIDNLISYCTSSCTKEAVKGATMGTGKKKIEIKKKEKIQDRMVAFSKRRRGLFEKANQLCELSGAKIAAIVFSPAGKPYVYGHPFFDLDFINNYYTDTTKFCSSASIVDNCTNFCSSSSSSVSDADNEEKIEEDEYYEEFEYWRTWLKTMELDVCHNVDYLLSVKNDLQQIRDKLINTIDDFSE